MRFWDLIRPERALIIAGIVLQGLGAVAGLVPMIATVELVGLLASGGDHAAVWRWLWIAFGGISARFGLAGLGLVLTHLADARLCRTLRERLSAHLVAIPMGDAARLASGRVKKLVTDDVSALHTLVAHAGGDMVIGIVTAVAAFGLLLGFSWPLALVALIPVLGFIAAFGSMMGAAVKQYQEYDEAKAKVNTATVEFARGIAVVKTFGRAGRASAQYRRAVEAYATFFWGWMGPMVRGSALGLAVVSAPSVIAVMTVGGLLLLACGATDLRGFAAGLVFGIGLAGPLTQLESSGIRLRTAREAAARIGEFLAIPPLPQPARSADILSDDAELRAARFRYDEGGPEVLSGVELALRTGTVTALVGPSGSGKSTLASLLPRFWDVSSGAVVVGGSDVRELDGAHLFQTIGFVFQSTRLVPMTIRENIRLGRPDARAEEVVAAATAANLHERILALPRGYDSVVGEDAALSGGEAQRVAVARALLDDAPVLVLDEPMSFADPENEVALQRAIAVASSDRTVLIIAHRLDSIVGADQISVLDRGRIIEAGPHERLLEAGGTYRRLWDAQHPTGAAA